MYVYTINLGKNEFLQSKKTPMLLNNELTTHLENTKSNSKKQLSQFNNHSITCIHI